MEICFIGRLEWSRIEIVSDMTPDTIILVTYSSFIDLYGLCYAFSLHLVTYHLYSLHAIGRDASKPTNRLRDPTLGKS